MNEKAPVVLIADDIPENIDLLEAYLYPLGCEILTASNGAEAYDTAIKSNPDIILLDVMMPQMTGIQVCEKLKALERFQFTPILMVTSLSEVEDKVSAINAGATDFLTKPVNKLELTTRVKSLLGQKSLYDDLVSSYDIIVSLALAIEARDHYTKGHSERVAGISRDFAAFLGFDYREQDRIYRAGLLHDIGKIGIADGILNKPGKLTLEEYSVIKEHPLIGARIISSIRNLSVLVPYIRSHHERWDGDGHPDGLKGSEIPVGARIISIADTYDAITSRRVYNGDRTHDDAYQIFSSERDHGQWDPELVTAFLKFITSEKNIWQGKS